MQDELQCPLCIEDFNDFSRKQIQCTSCKKNTCLKCFKTWILQCTEPQCAHCKRGYTDDFIESVTSSHFMKSDYRKTRVEFIWELEKSVLAQTIVEVELDTIIEKYNALDTENRRLLYPYYSSPSTLLPAAIVAEYNARSQQLLDLSQHMQVAQTSKKEKRSFLRPCPSCNGFLSQQWKCMQCDERVCKDCHSIKKDDHACKQDDVESAKLIEKDCKACPKCGVYIIKTYGCSQMWCTNCKSAWDWNTQRIINGPIHNPHFADWQLKQGVDAAHVEDPCAQFRFWPWTSAYNILGQLPLAQRVHVPQEQAQHLNRINRLMIELSVQNDVMEYTQELNKDVRKRYIKDLNVDRAKRVISLRETLRKTKKKKYDIGVMVRTVGYDLVMRYIRSELTMDNLLQEATELKNYSTHQGLPISDDWRLV